MKLLYTKRILFVILVCVAFKTPVFSQASDAERKYYFDDNNISSSKNIIKTDLWWLLHREVSFMWEHYYAQRLSFEVGMGYMLPGYTYSLWKEFFGDTQYKINTSGNSFFLQNRFYVVKGFKSPYFNLGIKARKFRNLSSMDYFIGAGWQYLVGNHLKIDADMSFCIRKQHSSDGITYAFDPSWDGSTLAIPISIRIGYLLFK